jgi:hypothetical protein
MPGLGRVRGLFWAVAAALTVSTAHAQDAPQPRAVWREVHVDFSYFGRTSRYSCEGLRGKVRSLLSQLGARRDLRLYASGCEETGNPPRLGRMNPGVTMIFSAPAPAAASARPMRSTAPAPVQARYQPFIITVDAFRNMGVGDCEFVADFVRQVLPRFAVRNLQQDIRCLPNQLIGSRYRVQGEVLKAEQGGAGDASGS